MEMEITPKLSAQIDRDLVHRESETEGKKKAKLCFQGKNDVL